MLYPILALLAGFALLIWSADRFVMGAAGVAKNFGMSPLLIGLTIVSIGTSAPEILVSTMAVLNDSGPLAVGNAIGSNIANIALVLGVTALVAPLPVKSGVLKKELPLLLAVTLLAGVFLFDLTLSFIDGILLVAILVGCLYLFAQFQKGETDDSADDDEIPDLSTRDAILWLIVGLVVLAASSRLLVWGATDVARFFGVSELVIGLTIVAIGTSLPELAASIASALKNHHDIAIGNVVGSNIFNLAAVLAVPGLLGPVSFSNEVITRDYVSMSLLTVLLIAFALWKKPASISRPEGGLLCLIYAGYLSFLYVTTV